MPDQPKFQDAERIDLPDLQFLAGVPLEASKQWGAGLVSQAGVTTNGVARSAPVIISGFKPVVLGAAANRNLQINRGVAVLGTRDAGVVSYGALTTEGDAQITLTLPNTAGTYGVYIRFEQVDGGFANRVFWDPSAPGEFAQSMSTRRVARWGMAVSTINTPNVSPGGGEWLKVGEATVSGGSLSVTPQRPMLFEGAEGSAFASQWGSGNDRNANRDLYGIKDLRMFANAALKKIEEIQSGTARWWTATPEPLDQKVSKNGDSLNGNYTFLGGGNSVTIDGSLTTVGIINAEGGLRNGSPQDIGTNASPFGKAYLKDLQVKDTTPDVLVQATGAVQASLTLQNSATPSEQGYLLYALTGPNVFYMGSDAPIVFLPSGASSYPLGMDATSLIPENDNTIKLGTATNRWEEMHAHDVFPHTRLEMGTGKVVGDFLPLLNGGQDLGNNTVNFWRDLFAQGVNVSNIRDNSGGTGNVTATLGALIPNASGKDLGSSGARWDVFGATGNFSGQLRVSDELVLDGAASGIRAYVADGLVVSPPPSGTGDVPTQVLKLATDTGAGNGSDDKPFIGFYTYTGGGQTNINGPNALTGGPKSGAILIRVNAPGFTGDKWLWVYDSPGV